MKLNIDKVKMVKITGTVLGIAGTLIANWVTSKETDSKLEKLVSEHLNKDGES